MQDVYLEELVGEQDVLASVNGYVKVLIYKAY